MDEKQATGSDCYKSGLWLPWGGKDRVMIRKGTGGLLKNVFLGLGGGNSCSHCDHEFDFIPRLVSALGLGITHPRQPLG